MDTGEKVIFATLITIVIGLLLLLLVFQPITNNVCRQYGYTTSSNFTYCECTTISIGNVTRSETVPLTLIKNGYVSELGCGQ